MENAPTAKGWRNPAVIAAIIGAIATILVAVIGPMSNPQPPSGNIPNVESTGGVAAGRDIRGNSFFNIGLTFEQVQELIQTSTQELKTTYQAQVDELSQRLGVTQDAVIGFFDFLKREQVPPEKLPERLSGIAQHHREMLDRLADLASEGPTFKAALIDEARTALKESDYDRADVLLQQAEAAALAVPQHRSDAAPIHAVRGEISLTQLRYQEAAGEEKADTRGFVGDSETRTPISQAKVTFRLRGFTRIVYTDSEGVYILPLSEALDDKTGRIFVEKEGYKVYDRNIEVGRILEEIYLESAQTELQITYPTSNSTVPARMVEIKGVGADPSGTIEVEVLTNEWYLQDGTPRIEPDGSWTYGPCHLTAQGQFNNNTIRATIIKDGERGASASVSGVVRQQ